MAFSIDASDPLVVFGALAALIFLGFAGNLIFSRLRFNDTLILILVGVIIGPVLTLVDPAPMVALSGIIGPLALILILFDGGLALKFRELAQGLGSAAVLGLMSFIGTLVIVGGITAVALDVPFTTGMILGAILGGTSALVVLPSLKHMDVDPKTGTTLGLESALTDVLVVVVSFTLIAIVAAGAAAEESLDEDLDGLPDAWERQHFDNLGQGPDDDPDGDDRSNRREWREGTDPLATDTGPPDEDGDGMADSWEEEHFGTLDARPDSDPDGDNRSNVVEYLDGTDPRTPDEPGEHVRSGTISIDAQGITSKLLITFSMSIFMGLAAGLAWLLLYPGLREKPFGYMLTLGFMFFVYVFVEWILEDVSSGGGPLAVLAFGIILGNNQSLGALGRKVGDDFGTGMKRFQGEISFLVRTFFFVFLGIIVDLDLLKDFYILAISVLILGGMLVARYLAVVATTRRLVPSGDDFVLIVMMPRGLAAAVLAAAPFAAGIPDTEPFIALAFLLLVWTNLLSTVGAMVLERGGGAPSVSGGRGGRGGAKGTSGRSGKRSTGRKKASSTPSTGKAGAKAGASGKTGGRSTGKPAAKAGNSGKAGTKAGAQGSGKGGAKTTRKKGATQAALEKMGGRL